MSDDKVDATGYAFIGIGLAGLGLFGALAAASGTMGAASIPVWIFTMAMVAFVSRSTLAKALSERIRGGRDEVEAVPEEVYAELDDLRTRVGELEDRQDFSERLLAEKTAAKDDR